MEYECYDCPGSVHIRDNEIDKQIKRVKDSGILIVDNELYRSRIDICSACDQFIYGTTCMSCGCLVKIRALNALKICPHPSGNKW